MHHLLVVAFQALFLHLLLLSFNTAATRLPLVHRDHMLPSSHEDYRLPFEARMKRDAMRVASLTRLLAANEVSGFETGLQNITNEYYAVVGVGTPPQNLTLLIHTASDLLWVNCRCDKCKFHPTSSTSFANVGCNDTTCQKFDEIHRTCDSNWCIYNVTYGASIQTYGTMAMENITIGNTTVQNVSIGCSNETDGLDTIPSADGILGLGGGSLSIVSQLGGFSYCLGNPTTGGWLEFVYENVPRNVTWAKLVYNPYQPSSYYIDVVEISVGGEVLDISAETLKLNPYTGDGGMILETGTAVTRLVNDAYEKLRDKFKEKMSNYATVDSQDPLFDTCYNLQGHEDLGSVVVPTVLFNISSHGKDPPSITFEAKNSLIVVDNAKVTYCLAFASSNSNLNILGSLQQQGSQITIDAYRGSVGFGPGFC